MQDAQFKIQDKIHPNPYTSTNQNAACVNSFLELFLQNKQSMLRRFNAFINNLNKYFYKG